MGGFLVRLLA
jgi:hypothetical protein